MRDVIFRSNGWVGTFYYKNCCRKVAIPGQQADALKGKRMISSRTVLELLPAANFDRVLHKRFVHYIKGYREGAKLNREDDHYAKWNHFVQISSKQWSKLAPFY